MNTIKAIAIALMLSACAKPYPVIVQQPCPTMPALPKITAQELAPLSNSAYAKLVRREQELKNYIRLLEVNCAKD